MAKTKGHHAAGETSIWDKAFGTARKHPTLSYYLALYVAVIIAFIGMNFAIFAVGRECMWHVDAQPLYLNIMAWNSQVLRDAISSFASGGGFEIPMYTYSLGYGADTIMTMGAYLDDPLNLLAIPFPAEYTNIPYVGLVVVRLLLAATTFSLYCFSRGHGRRATFVAAVVYICCGFVVYWGVLRHPKFIDWAVLLPLMFMAADMIFERKNPMLFIVTMFLQFFTSIYFSYMACIALLVYCLIKYFVSPRERSLGDFLKLVATFAVHGVVAFLLSAVFSLPQIMALLSQGRATGGAYVPLLFPVLEYLSIPAQLIGGDMTSRGMTIGAFAMLAILVFVMCRHYYEAKDRTPWLIGLILCVVGLLIPFIGHAFNGMGYVTDRWMLLLGFVCSYIVCMTIPVLPKLRKADWKRVTIGVVVVVALVALFCASKVYFEGKTSAVWPFIMAVLFFATFLVVKKLQDVPNETRTVVVVSALVILCVSVNSAIFCSSLGDSEGRHFTRAGVAGVQLTEGNPAAPIDHLGDDGVFRHSYPRVYDGMKNSSLTHGSMAVDFYSSYYNQFVDDFRTELGLSDHHLNYSYAGSTFRLPIEDITGVKYFVTTEDDTMRVPYGFVDTGKNWGRYLVYQNENSVPIAFASDAIIPRAAYDAMTMVERQEALMQGIVVDPSQINGEYEEADIAFNAKKIDYEVVKAKRLDIEENRIVVKHKDAMMVIAFDGLPESETYLCLNNLDYQGLTPVEVVEARGDDPNLRQRIRTAVWQQPMLYTIWEEGNGDTHVIEPHTRFSSAFSGKKNWVINMDYSEKGMKKIKITFSKTGIYTFDSIDVVCQPVKPVVEQARNLANEGLQDLKLETNRMSAKLTLDSDDPKLAFFSIAYTPGWSVKVDGAPAEVVRADTAFMAVEVAGKGTHEIEWSYMTPGLVTGAYMSLAGLLACLAVVLLFRFVKKQRRR